LPLRFVSSISCSSSLPSGLHTLFPITMQTLAQLSEIENRRPSERASVQRVIVLAIKFRLEQEMPLSLGASA
jgi:hypothetical protein